MGVNLTCWSDLSIEELDESTGAIYEIIHDFDNDSSRNNIYLMNKKIESMQRLLGNIASDSSLHKTASFSYRLHKLQEESSMASTVQVGLCMEYGNMKFKIEFEF